MTPHSYQELVQENEQLHLRLKNKEKEINFSNYFADNKVAMLQIDVKSKRILAANIAALNFYGFTQKELVQKTIYDLNTLAPQEVDKKMKHAIKNESNKFDFKHRLANGEVKDVQAFASTIKIGNEINVISSIYDITERKKNKDELIKTSGELNSILNAFTDGVYMSSFDYVIQYLNPSMVNQIGYDAIGEKCYQAINNFEKPCKWCYLDKLEQVNDKAVVEVRRKDKCYIVTSVLLNQNSKLSVYHDITKIKKTKLDLKRQNTEYLKLNKVYKSQNDELILSKEKAEESDKLKSAFIANMSHEIRTPMNGILGFLDFLKEPNLNESTKKKYIDIVNKSGERLLNTINDIIEISQIDAGLINLNSSTISLDNLLIDLHSFFLPLAEKKGLKLNISIPNNEILIKTDKAKLESIFTNLIGNAIKFTDRGAIEIGINKEEGHIMIFVKDTGRGIDANKLEMIFNRFSQAELNLTKNFEGNGLGLAISKAYVNILGGEIWADSILSEGSTFFVKLRHEQNELIKPEKQKAITVKVGSAKKSVILIAEDDETSFQYFSEILNFEQCKILRAKNGKEAVEICKNNLNINLVFMDIKMPIMNGYEATRKILEFRPNLPIITQTAYVFPSDLKKAKFAGCVDYISKPISKDKLKHLLNLYL